MKITLVQLVLVLLGTLKEQEETHVSQQRIDIWGCSENFDDCGTARADRAFEDEYKFKWLGILKSSPGLLTLKRQR